MRVENKLDSLNAMLAKRGLQPNGRTRKLFTSECARYMDKYVPMNTGITKNTRIIDTDSVTYNVPNGKFVYFGKVMVADNGSAWAKKGEKKHVINRDLTYRGAPKRGKLWDKPMWQNHKYSILDTVAKAAGGKAK